MVLPHKIATLLYCFDADDRLLLLERTQEPNLGKWSPPGGKVHADRGELVDLLLGEHAEAAGDVDVDRVVDRLHAVTDLRHQPLVGPADGGDDAELRRAGLGGLLGGLRRPLGQGADLGGHHRKAATGLARTGRLDPGVQGQEVGLEGDFVDDADDVGNLA